MKSEETVNPFHIAKLERSITLKGSLKNGLQLQHLNKFFATKNSDGFTESLKFIFNIIENTLGFFNTREKMTENQIIQLSLMIMERWPNDNIEDVILALKNAKMGHTKIKVYGRVDGEVIMSWIEEFLDKKCEELEKVHHNKKQALSEPINFNKLQLEAGKYCSEEEKQQWIEKCKELANGNKNKHPVNESVKIELPKTREAWVENVVNNIKNKPIDTILLVKAELDKTPHPDKSVDLIYKDAITTEINQRVDELFDQVASEIRGESETKIARIQRRWEQKNMQRNNIYDPIMQVFALEREAQKIERERESKLTNN